jgi:hypothetical protein
MIIRNAAQCAQCKDIIESTHVHDFKECSCGNIFVDGGREYLRHGWKELSEFVNLSEVDNA